MKFSFGRNLVRLTAGALAALLLGVLAAPSAVRASCGDYVLMRSHGDHRALPGHSGPDLSGEPAAPTAPLAPCSGPHCSGHRPLPLPPPAVIPVSVEHWACLPGQLLRAGPRFHDFLTGDRCPRPTHSPSSIFHPPRLLVACFSI
jgi:hypothetical protein